MTHERPRTDTAFALWKDHSIRTNRGAHTKLGLLLCDGGRRRNTVRAYGIALELLHHHPNDSYVYVLLLKSILVGGTGRVINYAELAAYAERANRYSRKPFDVINWLRDAVRRYEDARDMRAAEAAKRLIDIIGDGNAR